MSNQSKNQDNNLEALRHTAEHVLHQAMTDLYPGLLRAMGPPTEDGFYFDFDYEGKISEADFPKIEKRMQEIIDADFPLIRKQISINKAKDIFKNNPYKLDWLSQIEKKGELVTVYWTGNPDLPDSDIDLCKGPHVSSTGKIKAFKLLSVAGAYWHGDEKNKMLTRIYGTAFFSEKDLRQFLKVQEEAKKRDHRVLGQKLELFIFDDEVGPGLPLWLPKGAFVRHKIMEFAFNTYLERGYQPVVTPHISNEQLWQHSGHLDFYKESMYNPFGIENEKYRLKPMNCPFHVKMYKSKPRSYKELPIRWTEMGTVYRYEKSGVLHGLTRVRGFTQDDAHIICRPDQLHGELVEALNLTLFILKTFGFKEFEMNLSVRNPQEKAKFAGSDQGWEMAEKALIKALKEIGYHDYVMDVGGAVFYGPKIDVKIADSLGRMWQLSTIQFDFNLPGRFEMSYIGEDGNEKQPFMIHRALLGSLERFMGIYIEHTSGSFPVWLSPIQVKILPITDRNLKFAIKVLDNLKSAGIRAQLDSRSESLGKKIRNAQLEKIPYMLIIGDQEEKENKVRERGRSGKDNGLINLDQFIKNLKSEIESKTYLE